MSTILWQSRSQVVYDSLQTGELLLASNGGNAYDYQAAGILMKKFKVIPDPAAVQQSGEGIAGYWWRMRRYQPVADVCIMEPFPLIFGNRSHEMKSVAMIHHLDEFGQKLSLKHRFFFYKLKQRLREVDLVITVSAFWQEYLNNIGCKNVKVIYNSFSPSDYIVSREAVSLFRKKHNFNFDQPLVYIGNASRQKGVYETYRALKDSNYQLVMTGAQNKAGDLPVKFLNLSRKDYILLLNAADVVITMSKLTEGWNRIAHEALLCKTPVIGSGSGGMKELLTGAGQQIVTDFGELNLAIQKAIANKADLGHAGYNFVSRFDPVYFENEWVGTINNLLKE